MKAFICREYKWTEQEFDSQRWDFIDAIFSLYEKENKMVNKKKGVKKLL